MKIKLEPIVKLAYISIGDHQIAKSHQIVSKVAIQKPLDVPEEGMHGHSQPAKESHKTMVLQMIRKRR